MENIIKIQNLCKSYGEKENKIKVLKDINLDIKKGEFIAIIGASGSGKSTLMNIMGCLDQATTGDYEINNKETRLLDADGLSALRREYFGFIFQKYNLLSTMSALNNVALPAIYLGLSSEQREKRALELLDKLGLKDKINNKPNALSGGQQQRVSIARALMNGGQVIFADEPTGALDSKSGEVVMDIIKDLHREGHTIILVTHDSKVAQHAERIIELKDGEIISDKKQPDNISRVRQNTENKPALKNNLSSVFKDQFWESFKMAMSAIGSHKLRSFLTMLGIIIGIASVVSIVALGKGSQEKILENINSIGTNTIDIMPGEGFGDMRSGKIKTLTATDSDILNKQPYVLSATPNSSTTGTVTYKNIAVNAQVQGVGAEYFDVKGLNIDIGSQFYSSDIINSTQVAVIDNNAVKQLFVNNEKPIGEIIMINQVPLKVIGVTKPKNSGFGNNDSLNIWSPYSTVMNRISGSKNIDSITVRVKDTFSTNAAQKNIIELISNKHGKKDFFTFNSDSIKETITKTTNTMTLMISSIALISLIVGGIGVMNIMLVSVTERTKEIGIRMAIGARQSDILQQFLIEAVLICMIGGVSGIAISYGISLVFNHFITNFAMNFSAFSIIMAVLCSSMIGIIFGFVPARNASKLNPIDALARE